MYVYVIYLPDIDNYWCKGNIQAAPCKPYLWWDRKQAEKKMATLDNFYSWTRQGFAVEVVEYKLEKVQ
jgi:hypothetical protein